MPPPPAAKPRSDALRDRLAAVSPDQLSPLDALALVYDLKALARGND